MRRLASTTLNNTLTAFHAIRSSCFCHVYLRWSNVFFSHHCLYDGYHNYFGVQGNFLHTGILMLKICGYYSLFVPDCFVREYGKLVLFLYVAVMFWKEYGKLTFSSCSGWLSTGSGKLVLSYLLPTLGSSSDGNILYFTFAAGWLSTGRR